MSTDAPKDPPPNNPDKQVGRRAFFRRGLGELLKPLAEALAPVERTLSHLDKVERRLSAPRPSPTVMPNVWLRPPGALVEQKFLETCSRCAACVEVCPALCIKLDRTGTNGRGAPYIDPTDMACVACDGLLCMPACPSGALVVTPLNLVKMGTAVWKEETCGRTRGEDCTKCVDVCPMGSAALEVSGREILVKPLSCIGCGTCQQHCPTDPKSIVVIPKAAREA
jgi:MauM/NapG family ferredoxin protein